MRPIQLSWRKKLRYTLLVFCVFYASVEIFARVGSYLYYGRNPYYLLYGYRSWTNASGEGHSEKLEGYFKFPPDRTIEYGTPEPCRINNQGFRGADFEAEKPEATFRIICMGASSTFGYLNRDDETYPFVLEQLLSDARTERRVEVVNAGVPHFTTDNIVAAMEGELLDYEPDLFTVYTGCADAVRPLAENSIQKMCRVLDEYSAAYAGFRKAVNAVSGPLLFGQWTSYMSRMDRAALDRQVELHTARTRANFTRIIELARERGVPLIVIRQPVTTWPDRLERGLVTEDDHRRGYEREFVGLTRVLERRGWLVGYEVMLYVHHHLIDVIDELSRQHGLLQVDNIALIAEEPAGLATRVHLTADANRRLAGALQTTIRPLIELDQ